MTSEERAKKYHLKQWNSLVSLKSSELTKLPKEFDYSDTVKMLDAHAAEQREACLADVLWIWRDKIYKPNRTDLEDACLNARIGESNDK